MIAKNNNCEIFQPGAFISLESAVEEQYVENINKSYTIAYTQRFFHESAATSTESADILTQCINEEDRCPFLPPVDCSPFTR